LHLKAIFICLTLGLALFGNMSAAQQQAPTRSDLIDLIGQMPELSRTREELSKLGYKGEQLDLAVEHEQQLLKDKVVAGYIADRLLALYNGNLPTAWAPEGLISPLFDVGYTNLRAAIRHFIIKSNWPCSRPCRRAIVALSLRGACQNGGWIAL